MSSEVRNFVLFETDLFVSRPSDADIDEWSVGGDCAAWFYVRLLLNGPIRHLREPVMDDWGWTFAVSVGGIKVSVNVWSFFRMENHWLFGLEPRNRLFKRHLTRQLEAAKEVICDALECIISTDPRFTKHDWFAANPFDSNVTGSPEVV